MHVNFFFQKNHLKLQMNHTAFHNQYLYLSRFFSLASSAFELIEQHNPIV